MPIFDLSGVTTPEALAELIRDVLNQQQYQNGTLEAKPDGGLGGGRDDDVDVILPDGSRLSFRVSVDWVNPPQIP